MEFNPIIFDDHFQGREEALAAITRWVHDITPVMIYRTDDLLHSRRVLSHLEAAMPTVLGVYGNRFKVDYARTLALVHDDLEMITGDVTLHEKEQMPESAFSDLHSREREAIPALVQRYGAKVNGFEYAELLHAVLDEKILEALVVKYFDKFDAAGESWHEIWAGNSYFISFSAKNTARSDD